MSFKQNTRLAAAALGALLSVSVLAGCSVSSEPETVSPAPSKSAEEKPSASPSDEKDSSKKSSSEPGATLQPGGTATGAASVPFVNHDDEEAFFSHEVVSIEPAAEPDAALLVEKVPELKNYDIHLVKIESSYVSGDAMAHSAFYTSFRPVDPDMDEAQSVSVIGYDFCESNSIPSPGDDPSAVIENCIVAAVPKGAPAPAGVAWGQFDSAYDWYAGSPAFILKG